MKRFLIGAILALPSRAGAESGLTSAAFLQQALGARAAGMGGAYAAVLGSIDSAQYNPAGLATLSQPTISSTYLNGFAASRYGLLQYAHPTALGTLSAGFLYYDAGRVDLAFSNGTNSSATAEQDTSYSASYAVRFFPNVWLGGTYRYMTLNLAQTAHANASLFDIGGLVKLPFYGMSAGASYQFLGQSIRFEQAADPPPRTARYGLAFRFPDVDPTQIDPSVDLRDFDMLLTGDLVTVLYEKASPRFGLEMGLLPAFLTRVAMRIGWVLNRDNSSLTVGAGVEYGKLRFDYAFGRSAALENVQQLSLSYLFGKSGPARPVVP